MIKLNKENGQLEIDNYCFNSATSYFELENLKRGEQIETRITNTGSRFYTLINVDNGESKIMVMFHKEKLWIDIFTGKNYNFPPFTITDKEKQIILKRLADIGGEKTYSWGSVELNEDRKGGTVSILIKYK